MSKFKAAAVSALAVSAALAFAPAAQAITVYVGYADNLRASGFFPTNWIGSAGTVSESSGAQSFDSGAVRIDNTGGSAIVIGSMVVKLNGSAVPTYAIWSNLSIGAGQIGIFTQTVSYNFDSSDLGFLPNGIGIDGTHPLGGCTNLGALSLAQQALCTTNAPVVAFTVDGGAVQSFADTGHILDTFGYDFIAGSSDGNESINWNVIGSVPDRGGNGVPEPATLGLLSLGLAGLGFVRRKRKA